MSKYATRTCHECGVKRSQPNMIRDTIKVETGYSQRSLSTTEILFSPFSENAKKSVANRFTSPNKRKHIRNKNVWLCYSCAGVETDEEKAAREEAERKAKAEEEFSRAEELVQKEAKRAERKVLREAEAEAKRLEDLRVIAQRFPSFWVYALLQFPLYFLAIYFPLVHFRMRGTLFKAAAISFCYYFIMMTTFAFFQKENLVVVFTLIFAVLYTSLEYYVFRKMAKKGQKIPEKLPEMKKCENL